jgi:iron-sulfur cluster repair protein YtfE (RIC family)
MSIAELEQLVDQVLALRAERVAPHLSAEESALLSRINQGLPASERVRMRALLEKRDEQTLAPAEWQELTALTDKLELLHADRLAALADLAQVRGVTLDAVIQQLGLHFPDHD